MLRQSPIASAGGPPEPRDKLPHVLGPAGDQLPQRGEPGELVAVVIGVGRAPVGDVHRVDANAPAGRRDGAGLRLGEARRSVQAEHDVVQANPRKDRDAVPLRLAVTRSGLGWRINGLWWRCWDPMRY